jgi:hypothetical protein
VIRVQNDKRRVLNHCKAMPCLTQKMREADQHGRIVKNVGVTDEDLFRLARKIRDQADDGQEYRSHVAHEGNVRSGQPGTLTTQ